MNAVPAPAAQPTATAPAPKATTPAKKAPAKKAATKAPAKKATATKAPAKKAAPAKADKPKTPTVAERDMTAYEGAINEWKELKRDITDAIAGIAYQARRATPSEDYAKTHDEALAKLTSAVAAVRETARLLSEVAPKK